MTTTVPQNSLILGRGISGQGAKEALSILGLKAIICDESDFREEILQNTDALIVSPSIPKEHNAIQLANKNNIEVISEIELGARICKKPFIAVTGTNGKTTVTSLIAQMLQPSKVIATGNIGRSFALDALDEKYDSFVVETSSFQLEHTNTFCPKVALITNLACDHLDRHKSIESYIKAKLHIADKQTNNDYLILSADDIPCEMLTNFYPNSNVLFYSANGKVNGAYINKNKIYVLDKVIATVDDIAMNGAHNIKNALGACLASYILGADVRQIKKTLNTFRCDQHRLKFVTNVKGVAFYNDSKGTNVSATRVALESMSSSTCLIAGGSDKGYEYDELFCFAPPSLEKVCAIGETAQKIVDAGIRNGFSKIVVCKNLCQATIEAYRSGVDNVLLSPASASFDMYSSYAQRGEDFERMVMELKEIEKHA